MAFCSSTTDIVSDSNYNTPMSGTSTLPTGGFTRNSAGSIDATTMSNWVSTLLAREQVPVPGTLGPNPADASAYAQKANLLRTKIESEFCYYYRRYSYVLPLLLNKAVSAPKATLDADTSYQTMKTNTIAINKKLNDLIELLNGLTLAGTNTLKGYYENNGGLNSLNSQLQTTKDALKKSSDILQSSEMETEAKKAMIDYTLEKNSASRNMLGLYVFMNLVAGGLLFYLYRSA